MQTTKKSYAQPKFLSQMPKGKVCCLKKSSPPGDASQKMPSQN
jgi:hypothetical protein